MFLGAGMSQRTSRPKLEDVSDRSKENAESGTRRRRNKEEQEGC
jgi:hypothetical protein